MALLIWSYKQPLQYPCDEYLLFSEGTQYPYQRLTETPPTHPSVNPLQTRSVPNQ